MAERPLEIALLGHDPVLDLFAWIVDPAGRERFSLNTWSRLCPAADLVGMVAELDAGGLPATRVRYMGEDDVGACRVLLTETPLAEESRAELPPALAHVVQFGWFSPAVVDAEQLGVPLTVFERQSIRSVAEHAVTLALCLLRDTVTVDRMVRALPPPIAPAQYAYNWTGAKPRTLADAHVLVVGFGQVGQAVAQALSGLRPKQVSYWSRRPRLGFPALRHQKDLERGLRDADVAILALPATPETAGIIGARELDALGPDGILVNVSRGHLVQEEVLVAQLASRALCSAGLDVFASEPLPDDHPLRTLPNVLLSPHHAGGTVHRLVAELVELLRVVQEAGGAASVRAGRPNELEAPPRDDGSR